MQNFGNICIKNNFVSFLFETKINEKKYLCSKIRQALILKSQARACFLYYNATN